MRWPGVYGFGVVVCMLGTVWMPEHTREFLLSGVMLLAAACIAMSVRPRTVEDGPIEEEGVSIASPSGDGRVIYKAGPNDD